MNILLKTSRGRGELRQRQGTRFCKGEGRRRGGGAGAETELVYLRNCIVTVILMSNKFHKQTKPLVLDYLVSGWWCEAQSLIKGWLEKHILYT